MIKIAASFAAVALLTACATTSVSPSGEVTTSRALNNTGILYNGNNIAFVNSGSTACDNGATAVSGYPLRCGPQTQAQPQ